MSYGSNYREPFSILWEKALTLDPLLMAFLFPLSAGKGLVLVFFLSEKDSTIIPSSSSSFRLQFDSSSMVALDSSFRSWLLLGYAIFTSSLGGCLGYSNIKV